MNINNYEKLRIEQCRAAKFACRTPKTAGHKEPVPQGAIPQGTTPIQGKMIKSDSYIA